MAKDLAIYMATHNKKCSLNIGEDYIIPIQVGKVLSNESIAEIGDDIGDNISNKNEVYCELTALYCMWKNTNSKYIGLYHYRRRLDIKEDKILELLNCNNVIIPKKKYFRISLKEQYIKEHRKYDWDILINTLKEIYPEYYKFSEKIFNGNKIYRFNMFIMKKEYFDDYCKWIFPLISRVEEKIYNTNQDNYQNRYIGFMAERLFTLYIVYNNFKTYESDVLFENSKEKYIVSKNNLNNIIFRYKSIVNKVRRKKV